MTHPPAFASAMLPMICIVLLSPDLVAQSHQVTTAGIALRSFVAESPLKPVVRPDAVRTSRVSQSISHKFALAQKLRSLIEMQAKYISILEKAAGVKEVPKRSIQPFPESLELSDDAIAKLSTLADVQRKYIAALEAAVRTPSTQTAK